MLRRAKGRVESGEKWKDVAEDMDVNVSTLRKQIHQHLGKIDRSDSPKRFARESMLIDAIRLRNTERMSYPMIRDRVGWPRTTVALEQAIRRYAEHHKIAVYKGFPHKRRCRWENNDE
tara:strand:+ start:2660 stop:3013 length:354 start_codon:yes stop_codon:yes gene_type:complete